MPTHAPRGIVALITVLMVMAVMLTIGLTISAIGRDEIVLSGTVENGEVAFAIADACVEEGLGRLKTDGTFAGTSFELDGGSCAVAVTDLGGNARRVIGQGVYKDAIRIIQADVTLLFNGQGVAKKVKIDSWTEAN